MWRPAPASARAKPPPWPPWRVLWLVRSPGGHEAWRCEAIVATASESRLEGFVRRSGRRRRHASLKVQRFARNASRTLARARGIPGRIRIAVVLEGRARAAPALSLAGIDRMGVDGSLITWRERRWQRRRLRCCLPRWRLRRRRDRRGDDPGTCACEEHRAGDDGQDARVSLQCRGPESRRGRDGKDAACVGRAQRGLGPAPLGLCVRGPRDRHGRQVALPSARCDAATAVRDGSARSCGACQGHATGTGASSAARDVESIDVGLVQRRLPSARVRSRLASARLRIRAGKPCSTAFVLRFICGGSSRRIRAKVLRRSVS